MKADVHVLFQMEKKQPRNEQKPYCTLALTSCFINSSTLDLYTVKIENITFFKEDFI